MGSSNDLQNTTQRVYEKKDYLTDAPYAELYALREDGFAHGVRLEQMAEAATVAGFKTFKKMYNSYCQAKKGRAAASYINVTQFSGQPMELETGAWQADDAGITATTNMGEIVACVHPIMPVCRLVNVDTNMEKMELAYRRGNVWRRVVADKKTISTANSIVALADNGISVTSESAKYLVKYLSDVEHYSYDRIPLMPSVDRLGHISGHGFSPYVDELVYDGDVSFSSAFSAVTPHGSFDVWKAEMKRIRSYSLTAKIVLASSFASVLAEPLGVLSFFVHLWGTASGTGKTVALMVAASVWADPAMGRYIKTFDSTAVGLEQYAGFLNNLPMIIDELQLSRDPSGKSRFNVYKLAEGVGRLRGRKTGGIDRTVTWRNCILTSGETPLTQNNSGAGAMNRVIDIDCNDEAIKIVENGHATAAVVAVNYGHAGKEFVKRLTDDVIAGCKIYYDQVVAELSACDATDKQALAAALIVVADRLASEWFFEDKPITAQDLVTFLQTNESVNINERCYSYLCDWVASNSNRFDSHATDVYGVIENGWAYINRSVFNRALEDEGYSTRGFLTWAKAHKYIDVRDKGYTRNKRVNNVCTDCVVLMLPAEQDDLPF